jgi:hypothetical protein
MYWIVYSLLTTVEVVAGFFLSWIPFYHVFKIALLLWCSMPQTRGAAFLYARVVEPVMRKYVAKLESLKPSEVPQALPQAVSIPQPVSDTNVKVPQEG